jgi:hypothetical protein
MFLGQQRSSKVPVAVVVALLGLVHAAVVVTPVWAAGKSKSTQSKEPAKEPEKAPAAKTDPGPDAGRLPPRVQDMIEAMLVAVRSGRIEDLQDALDWNELKPELGPVPVADPIAHWKGLSKDGQGRDVLAVLGALLASPPATVPYGRDLENNRLYVWPRFAETTVAGLEGPDKELLGKIATPEAVEKMQSAGRYSGWRLVIGADGTWHSFWAAK